MKSSLLLTTALSLLCIVVSLYPCKAQQESLGLEEVLRLALKESHQAVLARLTREANLVKVEREKPNGRPTLDVTGSGTTQGSRVTFPRVNGTNAVFLPDTYARLDFTFEQVLYRPGYAEAKHRYLAQRESVDWDYRKELYEVILAVRKAYIDWFRAGAGIQIAQDALASAERYSALIRKQIESGLAKPVDMLTADAQLAEVQTELRKAENGRVLALANLNRWLNSASLAPRTLKQFSLEPTIPTSPDAAIELALQRRPEILSLVQNLKSSRLGISLAKLQNHPTFSLRWQWVRQTPTALMPENYMATTLEMRLPFWDGGRKNLDVMEAKAQTNRLEVMVENVKQGIALEVRSAWFKLRESADLRELSLPQLVEAEGLERVAEAAYRVGKGTALELQEAQRKTRMARTRRTQTQYDVLTAVAEFEHSYGETTLSSYILSDLKRGKP